MSDGWLQRLTVRERKTGVGFGRDLAVDRLLGQRTAVLDLLHEAAVGSFDAFRLAAERFQIPLLPFLQRPALSRSVTETREVCIRVFVINRKQEFNEMSTQKVRINGQISNIF